jgi:hypothetical protein
MLTQSSTLADPVAMPSSTAPSSPPPPSSTSGPSGEIGVSIPGVGPYFSWIQQVYLAEEFEKVL